jgi:hypothetical protein
MREMWRGCCVCPQPSNMHMKRITDLRAIRGSVLEGEQRVDPSVASVERH